MMIRSLTHIAPTLVLVSTLAVACPTATRQSLAPSGGKFAGLTSSNVNAMVKESRRTFRYGPFGGEGFWCDAIKLH
jgi:hypothetical protein